MINELDATEIRSLRIALKQKAVENRELISRVCEILDLAFATDEPLKNNACA